jgi:Tfp pilus assembly protein PilF
MVALFASLVLRDNGVDLDTYLDSQAGFSRASALMEDGNWSGAIAEFRNCAAKVERHAPTHGNIGVCLAQLGRKAEALAALDRALEIDPTYEPAVQNRRFFEQMKEGKELEAPFEIVDYGQSRFLGEPS